MHTSSVEFQSAADAREHGLSEVVTTLSYALDLADGQPPGHTLRTTAIGMRFADEFGLGDEARTTLYYTLLLKGTGSSSMAAAVSQMFGSDEAIVKRDFSTTDLSSAAALARFAWRNAGRELATSMRIRHFGRIIYGGRRRMLESCGARCRTSASIADRLGVPAAIGESIICVAEHWDGRGCPARLRGDAIPLAARIAGLAQTLEVFLTSAGPAAALDTVRARSGRWFDPQLVERCQAWRHDRAWWRGLHEDDLAARVQAMEPTAMALVLDDAGLDRLLEVFAGIVDAKSPYTAEHSTNVARYAVGIAGEFGLDAGTIRSLRRAALVHDVGKLGVPNTILDKAAPLTAGEREVMAQHPLLTWAVLRRVGAFRDFAWSAALHHERLDGSGYPWGMGAVDLDLEARILAVADVWEALTARRAYRDGLSRDQALPIIAKDIKLRYDGGVYGALVAWLER